MTATVNGTVDATGRLVSADPALAALHRRAGGGEGGVLAPPQLAAIVRLTRRLGMVVSRSMVVAGDGGDLDLWVRASPNGADVRLAIGGWRPRPGLLPPADDAPARARDFLRADADWTWTADAALRLIALAPAGEAAGEGRAAAGGAAIGDPLTRLFALLPDAAGALPILDALAARRGFDDQLATVAGGERRVRLSGLPLTDGADRFAGFRGSAVFIDPAVRIVPDGDRGGDAFGQRLDTALRGPLDRIVAYAETIRSHADGPLRQDYASYAADIATAGRHLLALVGDLVDLQAIERPDFRIEVAPIDLADVARRAAGLLGVRAADRGVRIDRPGDDRSIPAAGDFRRVLQILVNLIGNAVRYSPEGGTLWVRCEADGPVSRVIVADRGRGITGEDQVRIFDKFERVDPLEPGGTGLGLYISRRLARAMRGDITVESVPMEGSRFVLTLPAA